MGLYDTLPTPLQRVGQFKIVQTTLPLHPLHPTPHQTMFHIKNRELAPNAVSYPDPFSHLIILEKWAERQQQNANFNIFLPLTCYLLFGAGDQNGGNHRAKKCMEADVLHFWHGVHPGHLCCPCSPEERKCYRGGSWGQADYSQGNCLGAVLWREMYLLPLQEAGEGVVVWRTVFLIGNGT